MGKVIIFLQDKFKGKVFTENVCKPFAFLRNMGRFWQLTAHAWLGELLYLAMLITFQQCWQSLLAYIAALVSCIISAADLQCSSGANSVTSNLCVWNHSSRDVIVIIESTLCLFYLWLKVKPALSKDISLGGKGLARSLDVLLRIHLTHLLLTSTDCSSSKG